MRWISTRSSTPSWPPKKDTFGATGETIWRIWRLSFSVEAELIHDTHNIFGGGIAAGCRCVADGPARGWRDRWLLDCRSSLRLRRHGATVRTARVHVARGAAALRGEVRRAGGHSGAQERRA